MKVEIEISEETAACLWSNAWKQFTVAEIVRQLAEDHAAKFRLTFPGEVAQAVEEFRTND